MKDTLKIEADRLRLQAIVVTTFCLLAASTLPAVEYYYVFQHDGLTLGPIAWAHWIVVGVACTLGMLAHGAGNRVSLALHAVVCCMLGAALGGFDTAFWYQLATRCSTRQSSFVGCSQCSCADASTCTAADFAADPTCHSCTAYPAEACTPALQQTNKFLLAFTGLAALVFLAFPAFYSLIVLVRLEASGAAAAAKRRMVAFAVEQQTALVDAGEKPTVTPPMLATWVSFLLDCGDPECAATGEQCRSALSGRGFELPVERKAQSAPRKRRSGHSKRPKSGEVANDPRMSGSSEGAAYVMAEAGASGAAGGCKAERSAAQFVVDRH